MTDSMLSAFAPVLAGMPTCLILGSMPGAASLRARQYYAHPRNTFWPILMDYAGAPDARCYDLRCHHLTDLGIALWDVLAGCRRHGSLDSAIERGSETPNDFAALFETHPQLRHLLFNGSTAHTLFVRRVMPALAPDVRTRLSLARMPSTSPAHASMSFEAKRAHWHAALDRARASAPTS